MTTRKFQGHPCSICGSTQGTTYGSPTKINGQFVSHHNQGECDKCIFCKQPVNDQGAS